MTASTDSSVTVRGATSATLVLAGATNFVSYADVSADPVARNDTTMKRVRGRRFDALLAAHVADHQALFRRVRLELGTRHGGRHAHGPARAALEARGDPGSRRCSSSTDATC